MNIQKIFLLLVCLISYSIKPQETKRSVKRALADAQEQWQRMFHSINPLPFVSDDDFVHSRYPVAKQQAFKLLEKIEKEISLCGCDYVDATTSSDQLMSCFMLTDIRIYLLNRLNESKNYKKQIRSLKN